MAVLQQQHHVVALSDTLRLQQIGRAVNTFPQLAKVDELLTAMVIAPYQCQTPWFRVRIIIQDIKSKVKMLRHNKMKVLVEILV